MKQDMITVKTPEGLILKAPAFEAATSDQAVPALGEYWPGQGGHNAGFVPARDDVPAHYLVFAAKDAGSHTWGRCGEESGATSKTDGYANTQALLEDRGHPAALACAEHQADGHADFYLPAAAELYQGWVNTPELFVKECYYWSSTQRSAYNAFAMYFGDGGQGYGGKYGELRVRPVRRVFI